MSTMMSSVNIPVHEAIDEGTRRLHPSRVGWGRVGKRCLDVVGAIVGLMLLAPVFVLVALAIKVESRGPVLFRQTRVGLDGRTFTILKFRSMVVDAEARLSEAPSSR